MGLTAGEVRVHDDAFLSTFIREHGLRLVNFAYMLTGDRGVAEDLVQEALFKADQRWRSHGLPDHPHAYVRRVISHEFVSANRRHRPVLVLVPDAMRETAGAVPGPEDRQVLWAAMATLPARHRAVLVLRYYEDLHDEDIAAALGCSRATVRSCAARALKALRKHAVLDDEYAHRRARGTGNGS
jgi:RNA polymerase sigma-70 factor (sigma-E family)